MGMGGAGGKMNMGAMKSQLGKNMKMAQMKERMKAKAETNKLAKESANTPPNTVFSTGETVEKTPRGAKPEIEVTNTNTNNKNKKKKGKK
jgi:hypothetical protein